MYMISITDDMMSMLRSQFGEEATPEFLNLIRGYVAAHEHAFSDIDITKEKYLEWIDRAWEAGKQQRKAYNMVNEDMMLNATGILVSCGKFLSMKGKEDGYLSKDHPGNE